jgi:chromosome segregation ATPase
MKTKTTITSIFSAVLLMACGGNEKSTEVIQLQNTPQQQTKNVSHVDSINKLNAEIGELQLIKETKSELISRLSTKRDSIKNALSIVEASVKQVNDKKITPGITGVNTKLDELKGQKENLEEQVDLQKQELNLAEKKIDLLNDEKLVYDAQRKALYGKGAAPKEFVQVDSLLGGINTRISEQMNRVKYLKRSIGDIEEQKEIIDVQRGSLSSKVRDNYTAQQIFDDFSKEERSRLQGQLANVENQLSLLLEDESQLKDELALNSSKVDAIEKVKTSNEEALRAERLSIAAENAALEEQRLAAKKSRMNYAFMGIGAIALLLFLLFILGKKRNAKRKNI